MPAAEDCVSAGATVNGLSHNTSAGLPGQSTAHYPASHALCCSKVNGTYQNGTTYSGDSLWEDVPEALADPIMSIVQQCNADAHADKLNLALGAYRTEEGKPLVLECVRRAERLVLEDPLHHREYLDMGGDRDFCSLCEQLALGPRSVASTSGRIATVQTLSGTGALRLGAEFLQQHHPVKVLYLPSPSWGNHEAMFREAHLEVRYYRYWHQSSKRLDEEGMLADLSAALPGAVVLLHACAHNPTGVDPTPAQWRTLLALLASRRLLPFFDSAYQGFATGDLDQDAAAVRMAAASGQPMLLAQSFAKNMGMYGDRVGFLSVLCASPAAQQKVFGQLRLLCRLMYSNPPRMPAAIVKTILSSPELMALWQRELEGMAGRIRRCRLALHAALRAAGVPGDWEHVVQQQGMFSYTGLSEAQCRHLAQVWHVYLTLDGRLSLAGLSCARCEFLAAAIKDTVVSVPA